MRHNRFLLWAGLAAAAWFILAAYARLWTCYLRDPGGGVLRLHPDSSAQVRFLWERW